MIVESRDAVPSCCVEGHLIMTHKVDGFQYVYFALKRIRTWWLQGGLEDAASPPNGQLFPNDQKAGHTFAGLRTRGGCGSEGTHRTTIWDMKDIDEPERAEIVEIRGSYSHLSYEN
jgi:hypothetical protein